MLKIITDIIKYKNLVTALVQRHLVARYRGSVLGFFWSLLNPLCLMAVYSVVFHYYMRVASIDRYEIFLFCGLLPWIWCSSALSEGASSIVASGHLITKAMFPAHILPLVTVLSTGINFLLSFIVLIFFLFIFHVPLKLSLLLLPVGILLQYFFLYGCALILGSLNVIYRDVQHIIANSLTMLFFLCPIVYPFTQIPENWRFTAYINPFAGFTLFYQSVILNGILPDLKLILSLIAWSCLAIILGKIIYEKLNEEFAELL